MRTIGVFVVIVLVYMFHSSLLSGEAGMVMVGRAGMRTIFTFYLYFILQLYFFHLERLRGRRSLGVNARAVAKLAIVCLSLVLPLGVVVFRDEPSIHAQNMIFSGCMFALSAIFLFDRSGHGRDSIVKYFEERLLDRHGQSDLFTSYPPRDLSDIIWQLVLNILIAGTILAISP